MTRIPGHTIEDARTPLDLPAPAPAAAVAQG
jgi:hypothetical protein